MLLERIDTGLLLPLAAAAEENQNAPLISNHKSNEKLSLGVQNIWIRLKRLRFYAKIII